MNEETEGKAAVWCVNDEILLLLAVTYLIENYRRTCIILNLQYKKNPNSDKCIAIFQLGENERSHNLPASQKEEAEIKLK